MAEFDDPSGSIASRATIQSFDIRTLRIIQSEYPSYKTSLLVEMSNHSSVRQQLENLGFIPDFYSPHFSAVNKDLITVCKDQNMAVLPWTVNNRADMLRLASLGVSGLITDYPDRAIELFRSKN